MILSGFAGLGYEMVWTKMLAVALGHEIVAVLAVIAAFFTGLGIGAYTLDRRIRASAVPGRWYVVLEIVIGAGALALIALIPWFNDTMPMIIGEQPSAFRQWASVFIATLLLLLPATAAMGATLPAMERLVSALKQDGWAVSGLYAANTFGAVLGTMLTTFLIAPMLGFTASLLLLATVNFACALAVALGPARGEAAAALSPVALAPKLRLGQPRLAVTLFLTGLIGIGYQVLVIRVLSQVLENTVYTFASLLSVYLLGTALGAFLYRRYAPREGFEPVLSRLLALLALASLVGVALLWAGGPLERSIPDWLGSGYGAALTGEFLIALAVFLLPTLLMGATFSHLAQASRDSLGVGRALGINTIGAALAPLLFGVVLLPLVGSKTLLILVSVAYLFLIPARNDIRWLAAAPAGLAVALFLIPAPLRFIDIPSGSEIVSYDEGVMASVSVIRDPNDVYFLKVNNHYTMGSSASGFSDRRQTHLPLLLHPSPENVLYLGLGTGSTFAAAAAHPEVSATAVELIPEILPTIGAFGPSLEAYRTSERFRLLVSDARRYVGASAERYDVVIAEVFHPSRDGAGSLYTVEHFEAIRARLAEDGLFCQWLPLFQLDLATLRTIIRSFMTVYPDTEAYLAHYSLGQPLIALIGRAEPAGYHRGWIADRVRHRELAEDLSAVRLTTDFALFGGFLGAGDALTRFVGTGPLNTDNHPVVTYEAPRFVYTEQEPAWVRLLELVDALDADPAELLDTADPAFDAFARRLEDYWRARDAYLEAGVNVVPVNDVEAMLEQIAEPLLSVVRISNDFAPAYMPLLEMAYQLAASNPAGSRRLLLALEEAAPARPDAARLRRELFGN